MTIYTYINKFNLVLHDNNPSNCNEILRTIRLWVKSTIFTTPAQLGSSKFAVINWFRLSYSASSLVNNPSKAANKVSPWLTVVDEESI